MRRSSSAISICSSNGNVTAYQRISAPGRRSTTPPHLGSCRSWLNICASVLSQRPGSPADAKASPLVTTLRAEGFRVTATADDFLTRTSLPHDRIDAVATNPPFGLGGKLACQFIAHALELVPVVAMLTRIDFDSGKTRTHLFRDCRAFAGKIVLLDRVVWFECEGAPGPSENHRRCLWNKRHRGPPTISYARRP